MSTQTELLSRAAHCYLGAGLIEEACRCFDRLGDYGRVARLYEQQAQWSQAADYYERARAWSEAARCHQQHRQPLEAARCLLQADDKLHAAWVLADLAHRHTRARILVEDHAGQALADRLRRSLVLGRCEAGGGAAAAAALRLREVALAFGQLEPGPGRQQVLEWSLLLAKRLRRPDLTATLYAAAVSAAMPGAERDWEAWALAELGDAAGVPQESALPAASGAG